MGSYSYDALGRRAEKVTGSTTTRYLWGGAVNYAEMNGSDVVQRYFVYGAGIDTPLMVRETDGTVQTSDDWRRYVHRDGRNTVFATTGVDNDNYDVPLGNDADTLPDVVHRFAMDPWGYGTDESGSPFKYTSRRKDDETGNYYYRNRYMSPRQGRFLSQDPLGIADGMNMYAYVGNDPVNFADPMGLSTEETETEKPEEPTTISVTAPRINFSVMQRFMQQSFRELQQNISSSDNAAAYGDALRCGTVSDCGVQQAMDTARNAAIEEIVTTAQNMDGTNWQLFNRMLTLWDISNFYGFNDLSVVAHAVWGSMVNRTSPFAKEMAKYAPGSGMAVGADDETFMIVSIAYSGLRLAYSGIRAAFFGASGRAIYSQSGFVTAEGSAFKFTERYYNYLLRSGRPTPFLMAEEVLKTATRVVVDPRGYPGFYKYTNGFMEMVYNPVTREVFHIGF